MRQQRATDRLFSSATFVDKPALPAHAPIAAAHESVPPARRASPAAQQRHRYAPNSQGICSSKSHLSSPLYLGCRLSNPERTAKGKKSARSFPLTRMPPPTPPAPAHRRAVILPTPLPASRGNSGIAAALPPQIHAHARHQLQISTNRHRANPVPGKFAPHRFQKSSAVSVRASRSDHPRSSAIRMSAFVHQIPYCAHPS